MMKNLFKLFGTQSLRLCAIALVAVIGFSFAACDNGSTSGSGGKTAVFSVAQWPYDILQIADPNADQYTDADEDITAAVNSLTKEDIVFSPADVATIDSISSVPAGIPLNISVLKSGTVTVSIKDKNGVKFVKMEGASDQLTFTKE